MPVYRLLSILFVLSILFSVSACAPSERTFDVVVSGDIGLAYSGSYMVVSGGQSVSKSVEGTTPATYTVKGSIVSCTFQKKAERGRLSVIIQDGTKTLAQQATTAAYGVVAIATR